MLVSTYYPRRMTSLCIVVSPITGRLRWMEDCIVSDIGLAYALPRIQPQAYPYAQGWRVRLRYLSSRFPASGHATVP
jgi:hypothetical protein